MTAGWPEALAAIERDVVDAEARAAAGETPEPSGWQVPDGLGPLPVELAGRARDLLDRLGAVTEDTRRRRDQLASQLGDVDRRRDASHAYGGSAPAGPTNRPRRLLRSG